jgi:uncharacterized membrane protein YhaH (DUF805 family)
MTAFEMAIQPLKKYFDFSGRASRPEFWFFFLFVLLTQAMARVIDAVFGAGFFLPGPFSMLAALLLFVPQLAVTVRRLHDVNRSGRDLILPCVMLLAMPLFVMFRGVIAGIVALGYYGIVLLLFANLVLLLIKKGSAIPNRYGKSPAAFSFAG